MNTNNQNTEKNNCSNNPRRWAEVRENPVYLDAVKKAQALIDEEFFASHPQPPLQSAAFWAQDAILNQFSVDQPDGDSENENEEEGDEEEDEGMSFNNHPCSDVCSCIRYFAVAAAEPLEVEEEDFSSFFENCAYDSLLPPFSPDEFVEAEDQSLYDRKRNAAYEAFVQKKVRKTFDEHDNIPMDISEDEEEEEDDLLSIMSDLKIEDLEEDNLEEDDLEEECEFLCRHGLDCSDQVCFDCVRYLKQEACAAKIGLPELGSRQTTFWVDKETGEMVYNGNPNGSRFLNDEDEDEDEVEEDSDDEDDEFAVNVVLENNFGAGGREITRCFSEEEEEDNDLSDLPDLIDQSDDLDENQYLRNVDELVNEYGGGRYVYHPWQSVRVETLKRAIAAFESGPNYK